VSGLRTIAAGGRGEQRLTALRERDATKFDTGLDEGRTRKIGETLGDALAE